jgi:branched-chain amino acid transport system permease protein
MDSSLIIQVLISGLFIGGIYACVSIGFSLIWGVTSFLNVAQGEFVMVSAFTTYWLFKLLHIDPFLSLIVIIPAMYFLGYYLEKYVLDEIIGVNPFITILFTFGLSLLISNIALRIFAPDIRVIITSYSEVSIKIGGISIPAIRMVIFLFALAVTGALFLFLKKTRIGNAIRAASQNRKAAITMGIDIREIFAVAFGIGIAITGVGGSLLAIVSPINPLMGISFVLKAFVVSVLGGVGSLRGAFIGGILLGLCENYSSLFISSNVKNAIAAVILILILIVRPKGIFGERGVE